MYKFDLGLVVEHTTGSNYKVFCNYCGVCIGTMGFQQVKTAIFNTVGRGGVRCVPCRKSTCDVCGTYCFDRGVLTRHTVMGKKIKACLSCAISIRKLEEEVDMALLGKRVGYGFEDAEASEVSDENPVYQMVDGQRCTCGGKYEHVDMRQLDDRAYIDIYLCGHCETECVMTWDSATQKTSLTSYE